MPIPTPIHHFSLADLLINSELQLVRNTEGHEIQLRRKEFQLLHFLANNLNTVISKYAILDLVWEFSSFAGSNTLEVHLSHLRSKIQQLSSRLRIDTVRGVGYRLAVV
jgi:DNA-binding response OmpR family regulator